MSLPKRVIQMIHPNGFDSLFWKEVPKHKTYESAFKKLNSEYQESTGEVRYSNYESYRKARDVRASFKKK